MEKGQTHRKTKNYLLINIQRCSVSLLIMGKKSKTMRYHFLPIKLDKIYKFGNKIMAKIWGGEIFSHTAMSIY